MTREQCLTTLLSHRERFRSFLARRVADPAHVEELLQSALTRALERAGTRKSRGERELLGWFFRVLRNAVVDHYRARAVEERALARVARERIGEVREAEAAATLCACMGEVLSSLKPEYAQIIRLVDLEERNVGHVAAEVGITPNNAAVRLHRGRKALGQELRRSCGACAEQGCLDCSCRRPAAAS